LPLLVYSIYLWISEEVRLWPARIERENYEDWGDATWAMVWIIITECIIFAGFFAYWFWTKWHTISWSGAVGGTWPAAGVEHDMMLVSVNTVLLITSGVLAHFSLEKHFKKEYTKSCQLLVAAVVLGLAFLAIQLYEYTHAGFIWSDHPYGTAFFSLTGLHGLHVLIGLVVFMVVIFLMKKGHYEIARHDSFRAVTMYWHFVDAVWILLFLIVYLEVI
jgi:heme/copper-type cytochrome/quinol oxidase subunit 3